MMFDLYIINNISVKKKRHNYNPRLKNLEFFFFLFKMDRIYGTFLSSFFDSDFLVFSLLVVGFFLVVPKSSSQSSDLRLAAAEIDCDDVGVEFEYLKGGNRRTSGSELLPFSQPSLL